MKKFFQWLFIQLRIAKCKGKNERGQYMMDGFVKWNPLTYVVILICSIFFAIVGGAKTFCEVWEESELFN